MDKIRQISKGRRLHTKRSGNCVPPQSIDPRIEKLVHELIGRVADKWTMLALEVLAEAGVLRFTQLGAKIPGISQKMLTQTLRQMERDGLVTRTVHPVVPPKVEYELTELGRSLREQLCALGRWADAHGVGQASGHTRP